MGVTTYFNPPKDPNTINAMSPTIPTFLALPELGLVNLNNLSRPSEGKVGVTYNASNKET